MKKYIVTLTDSERAQLHNLIANGKGGAKKLAHARILLKADVSPGSPGWVDEDIASAVEVSRATVERVRARFVECGLDAALVRKPQQSPSRAYKLDGRGEAELVRLACSSPPEGRAVWTLQLLADKLIELEVVDTISTETVRVVLKKKRSSPGW